MIEHSLAPEVKAPENKAPIADGFIPYEEFLERAKIPQVFGVAGKVVEVLQRRVGNDRLGIEFIAQDMNLSKRTLQRRLQEQDISFAALRDHVRFNHAIQCLLERHMSIENTSNYLDFSDRTSFTNAFKRWTTLSPSMFRKIYRDYV